MREEDTIKKNFTIQELILIALLVSLSILSKRFIAPTANLLTDFIRVPGGSLTAGFSIMFLVVGKKIIGKRSTAVLMAMLQGLLALGMGSMMSLLTLVSYIAPGILIDILYNHRQKLARPISEQTLAQMACCLGVLSGAAVNNLLVFQLPFIAMILFYMIGILSGIMGGTLADLVCIRINKVYLKSQNNEKGIER